MKTEYVLGFLFRDDRTSVVMILKTKPTWQAGLLNGVGGKIEPDETPLEAMTREFREETGVLTFQHNWRQFCELQGDAFTIYCFTARETWAWGLATTTETEKVVKVAPQNLNFTACLSNVPWLIALALDDNGGLGKPYATVRY